MRDYIPYILGAAAGVAVALVAAHLFSIGGTAQLVLFALLPAFGGAACERFVTNRR